MLAIYLLNFCLVLIPSLRHLLIINVENFHGCSTTVARAQNHHHHHVACSKVDVAVPTSLLHACR